MLHFLLGFLFSNSLVVIVKSLYNRIHGMCICRRSTEIDPHPTAWTHTPQHGHIPYSLDTHPTAWTLCCRFCFCSALCCLSCLHCAPPSLRGYRPSRQKLAPEPERTQRLVSQWRLWRQFVVKQERNQSANSRACSCSGRGHQREPSSVG